MRATLDLDDDVAARLEELSRARGVSLSEVANQALRDALGCEAALPGRERGRFTVEPVNLGEPLLPDVDDISAVFEYAERLDFGDR